MTPQLLTVREHAPAVTPARRRQRLGVLLPVLAAVLILAFSTRRTADVTTGKFYVAAAVIAVLLLIFCTAVLRIADVPLPRPLAWLGLFTFICAANFPLAVMQGVPVTEWARHAFIVLCIPGFAWGAWLLNERAAGALYWVIAALCGSITLVYLGFWLQTQSFSAVRAQYANAFWGLTGGVFASVTAACLLFPFAMKSGRRWTVAAFVLAVTAVAATFSRTFWAAAPAALVITAVVMSRRRMLKASRVALMGTLAAIIVIAAGGVLAVALATRVDTAGLSGTQRVYESQAIFSAMRSDPPSFVAGAGFGAVYQETAVDTSSLGGGLGTNERDFSHDWYLQLLWNTGVLGLLAWAGALISWLRLTWRSMSPHALGCFAAVLAISLGSFTFQPFGDLGWDVLIGLLLGLGCRMAYSSAHQNE